MDKMIFGLSLAWFALGLSMMLQSRKTMKVVYECHEDLKIIDEVNKRRSKNLHHYEMDLCAARQRMADHARDLCTLALNVLPKEKADELNSAVILGVPPMRPPSTDNLH